MKKNKIIFITIIVIILFITLYNSFSVKPLDIPDGWTKFDDREYEIETDDGFKLKIKSDGEFEIEGPDAQALFTVQSSVPIYSVGDITKSKEWGHVGAEDVWHSAYIISNNEIDLFNGDYVCPKGSKPWRGSTCIYIHPKDELFYLPNGSNYTKDTKIVEIIDNYTISYSWKGNIDPAVVETNMSIFLPFNKTDTSRLNERNYGNYPGLGEKWPDNNDAIYYNDSGIWRLWLLGGESGHTGFNHAVVVNDSVTTQIDVPSGSDMSFCIVINIKNDVSGYVMRLADSPDDNVQYDATNNKFNMKWWNANANTGTNSINVGSVYHLCYVFDNSADRLIAYLNNSIVSNISDPQDFGSTPAQFNLGHRNYDNYLNATIGNVRYWAGYALTSAEVTDVFNTDLNISQEAGEPPAINNDYVTVDLDINYTSNESIWYNWSTSGNYSYSEVWRNGTIQYNGSNKYYNNTGLEESTGYYFNITVFWNTTLHNETTFTITTDADPCQANWQNTSWTAWSIYDTCDGTYYQDEDRNKTEYDANECPGSSNTTHYDYRNTSCCYQPYTPSNLLNYTQNNDSIALNWSSSLYSDKYIIYNYSINGWNTSSLLITLSNLLNNSQYEFNVTGYNSSCTIAESNYSNTIVTLTTQNVNQTSSSNTTNTSSLGGGASSDEEVPSQDNIWVQMGNYITNLPLWLIILILIILALSGDLYKRFTKYEKKLRKLNKKGNFRISIFLIFLFLLSGIVYSFVDPEWTPNPSGSADNVEASCEFLLNDTYFYGYRWYNKNNELVLSSYDYGNYVTNEYSISNYSSGELHPNISVYLCMDGNYSTKCIAYDSDHSDCEADYGYIYENFTISEKAVSFNWSIELSASGPFNVGTGYLQYYDNGWQNTIVEGQNFSKLFTNLTRFNGTFRTKIVLYAPYLPNPPCLSTGGFRISGVYDQRIDEYFGFNSSINYLFNLSSDNTSVGDKYDLQCLLNNGSYSSGWISRNLDILYFGKYSDYIDTFPTLERIQTELGGGASVSRVLKLWNPTYYELVQNSIDKIAVSTTYSDLQKATLDFFRYLFKYIIREPGSLVPVSEQLGGNYE